MPPSLHQMARIKNRGHADAMHQRVSPRSKRQKSQTQLTHPPNLLFHPRTWSKQLDTLTLNSAIWKLEEDPYRMRRGASGVKKSRNFHEYLSDASHE
ncbi:hypothetical protein CEXT_502941 [Caerostris extrusa]|uniref:Uncharacterized protein n=1 Tax=Caerostris extrusa TaxID=172846 RepID=A0AAV4PHY4_CAEEX|nr:hypothetical protein CEXT_502941 [Caerostris extrusa]